MAETVKHEGHSAYTWERETSFGFESEIHLLSLLVVSTHSRTRCQQWCEAILKNVPKPTQRTPLSERDFTSWSNEQRLKLSKLPEGGVFTLAVDPSNNRNLAHALEPMRARFTQEYSTKRVVSYLKYLNALKLRAPAPRGRTTSRLPFLQASVAIHISENKTELVNSLALSRQPIACEESKQPTNVSQLKKELALAQKDLMVSGNVSVVNISPILIPGVQSDQRAGAPADQY